MNLTKNIFFCFLLVLVHAFSLAQETKKTSRAKKSTASVSKSIKKPVEPVAGTALKATVITPIKKK